MNEVTILDQALYNIHTGEVVPVPNNYPAIANAVYNSPWAILPEKLGEITAFLGRKIRGENVDGTDFRAGPRPAYQTVGRVALLPLFGVLAQRMNLMSEMSGGTSTERFGAQFDAAVRDKSIKAIVLVADSPGGSVFGTQELATKIFEARDQKKVISLVDSMAASAAFWIAAQASEVVITPGGMMGSVGVIMAHQDESKAQEQAGVKTTLITSSPYKGEGDPSQPLSKEAAANVQAMVDSYHQMFVKSLARGRAVTENRVEKDFGGGRMKLAKDAVASGMADRIGTLANVLGRLGETVAGPEAAASLTAKLTGYRMKAIEAEESA